MFYCDVSCSFYTNNKEPKTKNKKQNKPDYSESKIEYLISDFQFARAAFFFYYCLCIRFFRVYALNITLGVSNANAKNLLIQLSFKRANSQLCMNS